MTNKDLLNTIADLLSIVDFYENITDPDGVCENGCSCGECENCHDYNSALEDVRRIKEQIDEAYA